MRLTTGADLKQAFLILSRLIDALISGKDPRDLVNTKLRLYRNYSIKLMLAWETCCRSASTPLSPFPSSTQLTDIGLGSGILFSYPELATIAGVQGVVVYALTSALPLLIFAYLGPIIRKKCPEGFVLTEWVRQRYGVITALWLSFLTLVTMFLYMVSELSAIGQVVNALTGLDALPILIVECVVTTVYTCESTLQTPAFVDNCR